MEEQIKSKRSSFKLSPNFLYLSEKNKHENTKLKSFEAGLPDGYDPLKDFQEFCGSLRHLEYSFHFRAIRVTKPWKSAKTRMTFSNIFIREKKITCFHTFVIMVKTLTPTASEVKTSETKSLERHLAFVERDLSECLLLKTVST